MTPLYSRSCWISSLGAFTMFFLIFGTVKSTSGLKCIQCGQYNDGVGSITPCLNYTVKDHLLECPRETTQCVKYVNAGTTVRECAPKVCNERRGDSWSTSIYCCSEEGCNTASNVVASGLLIFYTAFSTFNRLILN